MFMVFGYGAASTRAPELLRFGWCKAARSDAVARLGAKEEGGPSRNISHYLPKYTANDSFTSLLLDYMYCLG